MEQFCSRLALQLHMSAQKSPGRPWPFLSPRLVTFHCSELRPAHVGVRENWLCWAGTTSCPQLVPPGSPQFRVSAQLPRLLQMGPWHSRVGHLSPHPPAHLSHSLWICVVPDHLGLPHPAACCCVRGIISPKNKLVPISWCHIQHPADAWQYPALEMALDLPHLLLVGKPKGVCSSIPWTVVSLPGWSAVGRGDAHHSPSHPLCRWMTPGTPADCPSAANVLFQHGIHPQILSLALCHQAGEIWGHSIFRGLWDVPTSCSGLSCSQ